MKATEKTIMCQDCGERESDAVVVFTSKERDQYEKDMCLPCYFKLTAKQGLTYREWFKQIQGEEWTDNHAPLPSLINGYEAYCKANGLVPCWNG